MIDRDLANAQRQIVLAFGEHARRRHAFHLVADGHRVMGGIHDDGGGVGDFLHHVAARQIALDAPDAPLDLRIALGFLQLVANFLLGHAQRLVMAVVDAAENRGDR